MWESNPRLELGRITCCRNTYSAFKMAPTVGSDPTTFELTARCTTNCATWDLKIDMSIAFRHTTHSGLELATDDRSGI